MLHLALSCLQGRPITEAFDTLRALGADGVQLTPGNVPDPAFERALVASAAPYRRHHTFSYGAIREAIYWPDGSVRTTHERWSVHPPTAHDRVDRDRWLSVAAAAPYATEVMYPGELLGCGEEIARAMALGMRLAVDISHLYIQRRAGMLDDKTLSRLFEYDRVDEVHVSANDGRADLHRPLDEGTFGLPWARERLRAGTAVVLECYMHRLDDGARRRQIDFVRKNP